MEPSFFKTGTSALAHGLSHSSTTSSATHLSICSFRLALCFGLIGRSLVFTGLVPGSNRISNSIKEVLPKDCSGELKMSLYSLISSFNFSFNSGSFFSISFSSSRSSFHSSSTLPGSSFATLTLSPSTLFRMCLVGISFAICVPALNTLSSSRLSTATLLCCWYTPGTACTAPSPGWSMGSSRAAAGTCSTSTKFRLLPLITVSFCTITGISNGWFSSLAPFLSLAGSDSTLLTNSTWSFPNVNRVPPAQNSNFGFNPVTLWMFCRNAVPRLHSSATSLHTTALLENTFEMPGILMLTGSVIPTFSSRADPFAVPTCLPGNSLA